MIGVPGRWCDRWCDGAVVWWQKKGNMCFCIDCLWNGGESRGLVMVLLCEGKGQDMEVCSSHFFFTNAMKMKG